MNMYIQPSNRCWIGKWLELEDSNEVHTALVQQYGSTLPYTKFQTLQFCFSSAVFRIVQKYMFPSHRRKKTSDDVFCASN